MIIAMAKNATPAYIRRRLAPLYVAVFFQGFVLWYAIAKLFMVNLGFDDASIGVMVAAYSALMLFVETPSGILADRWSRKGVLIMSSAALMISSIVCGISNDIPTYIVGALFWGVFYALYTGTYDSVVYDTLVEETGKSQGFEKLLGKIKAIESVSWMAGALAGGLIGELIGLRETFFWTVPLACVSIVALWRFREPLLHKAEVTEPLKKHIVSTFRAVLHKGNLVWLLGALVGVTVVIEILYEFQQLWLIAIATPAVLFGPAFALVLSASGIGGLLAGVVASQRRLAIIVAITAMMLSGICLITVPWFVPLILAHTVLGVGAVLLSILFMHNLHDALPSRIRAGASSAVSTIARIMLIPTALVFGVVSQEVNVFAAAGIIVVLVTAVGACVFAYSQNAKGI